MNFKFIFNRRERKEFAELRREHLFTLRFSFFSQRPLR